jgi:alkaline phosphatase D
VGRGDFLRLGGGAAAAIWLAPAALGAASCAPRKGNFPFGDYPFGLGVASGDPWPESVVLWTRLLGGLPDGPQEDVPVRWEVAEDEGFRRVVRRGEERATPELGYSVHAEVGGLRPARWYWYRFEAGGERSPVGRTRTAPAPGADVRGLSFAFASCQAWREGGFPAYAAMAREDLDFVVHLGDYVYEERGTRTLEDYRRLHELYKGAPQLREAHAAFPFVPVLDDHEVDNDWAGEVSENDDPREEFLAMRAAAFQAYYEHMPLRRSSLPDGPNMRLHRRLAFGDLAELNVLDTRQHRTDQADGRLIAPRRAASLDETRTMTGDAQERWLLDGLGRSGARWNVVAQQTMMAAYDYESGPGERVNHDQWDGYAAARKRLLGFFEERRPSNPVVVSGDWHSSFVNDLKADFRDPGSETLATEFVGTSISSPCPWASQVEKALSENPHVKFFDGARRGYVRCTLDKEAWRSDFRAAPQAGGDAATTHTSWAVEGGRPGARPA